MSRSGRDRESELAKELRFHGDERIAALINSGVSEAEARRMVRQEFGGLDQVQEQCRDARPGRWLERLGVDITHSLRGTWKRPALTLTFIATIAVCTAVNTAVFTVIDSLLIRPLPFQQAERLIVMANEYPKAGISDQDASAAGDLVDREGSMDAVAMHALYQFVSYPLDRDGRVAQVRGMAATPSLFEVLRVKPAEGRLFARAEGEPGSEQVVVLTEGLRRELFGSGAGIGQALRISGKPYSVIGVLPAGFRFVAADARYFIPLALSGPQRLGRHANNYRYIARLKDGATVAQAQAQVNSVNARVLDQIPAIKQLVVEAGFYTHVEEFQPWLMRHVRSSLRFLWAAAFLVLLVGTANLAGLAIARAHAQLHELATRVALGATRADNVRRSLADGVVPALIGGLIGIAGAWLATRVFDYSLLPGANEITLSPVVAGYALAGAVFMGILAGVVALSPLHGLDLGSSIRTGARGSSSGGMRLRRAFVITQLALAFVLVSAAGLLTSSIRELLRVDPGFRTKGVWAASTYLPGATHAQASDLRRTVERIVTEIRSLPGVEMAGAGTEAPLAAKYDDNVILAEGYTMKPGESAISPIRLHVTPGYLETLGIAAVRGRLFDDRDTHDAPRAVIIDERLARRFWPDQDPIGRKMFYPGDRRGNGLTVIGVVRSIRLDDVAGKGNPNGVYWIPWQQGPSQRLSLVWRGPRETIPFIREAFTRSSPGSALFDLRSMEQRLDDTLSARRTAQVLVLVFAAIAALLTAIGVYGILTFLVSQRYREIGIRLAIGSSPTEVFRLFLASGAGLVAIGLLCGSWIVFALRPLVAHHLYGVSPIEPPVLAVAAGVLVLVSAIAIALPAYRASRIDPMRALRES